MGIEPDPFPDAIGGRDSESGGEQVPAIGGDRPGWDTCLSATCKGDTVTCGAGGGGGYVPEPGNGVGGSGGFSASTDANGLVHVTCPHHTDRVGNV